MDTLALTDRAGLYGAVRFASACTDAGIAPVLGADLAVEPAGPGGRVGPPGGAGPGEPGPVRRRLPARGGASVDPRHPRVTVLALAADSSGPASTGLPPAAGWARLCRLVSAAHLRGERGRPAATADLVAAHAVDPATGAPALAVLLGPDSEVGRALLVRRPDLAAVLLRRWVAALPPGSVHVEVVCHGGPPGTPASVGHAARLLDLAAAVGVPAVLTNAVRYATPDGAAVADVLDAARRLVVLDDRHVDRTTAEGYLAGGADMAARAATVAAAAGHPDHADPSRAAARLLDATAALAARCRLDPAADLSIGAIHLPEPGILGFDAGTDLQAVLAARCAAGLDRRYGSQLRSGATVRGRHGPVTRAGLEDRLHDELATVARLGFAGYFLAVAEVCDLVRGMGVRVAARGSGTGSLICYLLGVSGVDPVRHDLLMERFCHARRVQLPDVDVDVESDRRLEVYDAVLDRFGGERVTCVSMMDTYRVRHAVRDAGAALGLSPAEIDTIATAFPHIRARDVRAALADLPELRASGLAEAGLDLLFDVVERLDGLPRHVALHPCGVILSDAGLLDRVPVEASWMGYPMTQFDKDDVEAVGLLKLDVLGVRMQSAMAYAVAEVARVDGVDVDLDDQAQVPHDDPATYDVIRSARTLGMFQIESPGQRELVGKFAPETFDDLVVDISLFRPGPVKSDMVAPFLRARQGWDVPRYVHPDLEPALRETYGVVVFHEQVIRIVSVMAGCSLAEADEVRRALGTREGQAAVRDWFVPLAVGRGYGHEVVGRVWEILQAFASFGFCKAHAAAFALPTFQSAWLKTHHPAAFLAGVLTHDPGMYPKRLILDDARNLGIAVLDLDVNASTGTYQVERVEGGYGIRLSLAEVKGMSAAEVSRVVAGRPYASLADFWRRAGVTRPTAERLVLAGGFDELYGLAGGPTRPGPGGGAGYRTVPTRGRRGRATRRDLLVQVAELDRWGAGATRTRSRRRGHGGGPVSSGPQLALDLGDSPGLGGVTGLPEMTSAERVAAELEILGLDASRHVLDFYAPLLDALGVVRSTGLVRRRSRSELLVGGVKVATQTPPIRSGRRVVFLTLDDATGAVDATFFEDAQEGYAATVFHSWLLLVRGVLRRTGPRGVSLRATGAWELPVLWDAWRAGGVEAAYALLDADPPTFAEAGHAGEAAVAGAAASRAARPVLARPPVAAFGGGLPLPGDLAGRGYAARAGNDDPGPPDPEDSRSGSRRRVLVHASGFRQSPYADIRPAGEDGRDPRRAARKLWHASPGSSGR
jgi:error-prone DNA polymerase